MNVRFVCPSRQTRPATCLSIAGFCQASPGAAKGRGRRRARVSKDERWTRHHARSDRSTHPVGIEEHKAVAADEVKAATSRFGGEKEDHHVARLVIEVVDVLLALARRRRAVEAHEGVLLRAAQLPDELELFNVVRHDDDPIVRRCAQLREHRSEDAELATEVGINVLRASVAAPAAPRCVASVALRKAIDALAQPVGGNARRAADGVPHQLRMVANLFQDCDARQCALRLRRDLRCNEVRVQRNLQRRRADAHYECDAVRKVICEQRVRAPQHELVHNERKRT